LPVPFELADVLGEKRFGSGQRLIAIGRFRFVFAVEAVAVPGQFGLLAGPLLLPDLLGMAERSRLALDCQPPLAKIVFFELVLVLAGQQLLLAGFEGHGIVRTVRQFGRSTASVFNLSLEFGLPLEELLFAFAEPEPGGPLVGFELGDAGVHLGFAAIDFAQALAEMVSQLGGLQLELLAGQFGKLAGQSRQQFRWRVGLVEVIPRIESRGTGGMFFRGSCGGHVRAIDPLNLAAG
jgi:hypothetical protein